MTMEINPTSTGYELGTLTTWHREAAITCHIRCERSGVKYCRSYVTHWSRRPWVDGEATATTEHFYCSVHAQALALRHGLDFHAVTGLGTLDVLEVLDPYADPVTCLDCGQGVIVIDGKFIDAMGRCDSCTTRFWSAVLDEWAAYAGIPAAEARAA